MEANAQASNVQNAAPWKSCCPWQTNCVNGGGNLRRQRPHTQAAHLGSQHQAAQAGQACQILHLVSIALG